MSPPAPPAYAELAVTSNYSFLRAASHPDELVRTAAALGHAAIGIADRNSLAGVVRAHAAAKGCGLDLVVGARLVPEDGPEILCFPRDRAAYGRLCRLLSLGKRRSEKGQCRFSLNELLQHAEGQVLIVLPPEELDTTFTAWLRQIARRRRKSCYLALSHRYQGDDARRLAELAALASDCRLAIIACNDVLLHTPERKPLLDVVTCIREGCTIDDAGFRLLANGERHLKAPAEMARLFHHYPEALANTLRVVERCRFGLEELSYEYPEEITTGGRSPQQELVYLTHLGAAERYPDGIPTAVASALAHELDLIGALAYAPYFLTVQDIVRFARSKDILCQGRGSAANSAVCYCLGITAVDPARVDLLFERFVSAERGEPPDIDVDFEHERREEVIQYIYEKYGREKAGLAATVICYRSRSAVREVGKALGLPADTVTALAGSIWGWSQEGVPEERVRELGLDPESPRLKLTLALTRELIGFPRHLSQHVGGFVMTRGRLDELVPIENAAMVDRTVIEWDKDDLDALNILKVDVLALGMLTCLRKGFDLLAQHYGRHHDLASVPAEDPAVYDMLCQADSIGVFQVESRAQMTMLPRLKPRDFYDLVIEVAIVRPGPIQGDMVHPYLRRRNGLEKVDYPSEALRQVLAKTLGVPLFQEQAMKIAIVAAGFTPNEADRLRRAMATFRHLGTIHDFRDQFIDGMTARGYDKDFAERCFRQIEGFGDYGFPESHAASFALLVYVSAWLKCHYPAAFACALLNSQPMGFYAPAQIVRDAREHEVRVLPVDVNYSDWDCTLEAEAATAEAAALALRQARDEGSSMAPSTANSKPGIRARWDPSKPQKNPYPELVEGGAVVARPALVGDSDQPVGGWALRLGLRQVKGLQQEDGQALVEKRGLGYVTVAAIQDRAGLKPAALEALARADAFGSLGLSRREALWAIKALAKEAPLPLFAATAVPERGEEPRVTLPAMSLSEAVVDDYISLRLSLKAHPLSFFRQDLAQHGMIEAGQLRKLPDGHFIRLAGLVLVRQRPGSAKGVIFATLEDETGVANVVVWADVFERYRSILLGARLLGVEGPLQREGIVIHVVARRLFDLSHRLAELSTPPGEGSTAASPLANPIARADEVKRPTSAKRGLLPRSRDFH